MISPPDPIAECILMVNQSPKSNNHNAVSGGGYYKFQKL